MTRSAEFLWFFSKQFFHYVCPLNDFQAKCFTYLGNALTILCPAQFTNQTTSFFATQGIRLGRLGASGVDLVVKMYEINLYLSVELTKHSIKCWNYTNFIRLKKVDLSKSRIEDLEMQHSSWYDSAEPFTGSQSSFQTQNLLHDSKVLWAEWYVL